jgi:hypothetical protein
MQVDAIAVRLRPRSSEEATDLGILLCRHTARSVYTCHALVAVPVIALALASWELAAWLPATLIWCSKPWIDRTILFVLARAAFGQNTSPGDVWHAQRQVWWRRFVFTWTIRRLSPWRSLTEPVYQLEGSSIFDAGKRIVQIRHRQIGSALMVTSAFCAAEYVVSFALLSLLFWLAPAGMAPDLLTLLDREDAALWLVFPAAYGLTVLFLEPFYVAAGFGMYLNRRAELEAWDIEQEFRRAFA